MEEHSGELTEDVERTRSLLCKVKLPPRSSMLVRDGPRPSRTNSETSS